MRAWKFPCWKNTTGLMVHIGWIMASQNTSWPSKDIYLVYTMSGSKVGFRMIFPTSNTVSPCAWCPSLPRTSWCAGVRSPWGLFTEELLFITCTVYRKTFWKFFMDYVSSTYLISINCFRMLRLMNKKDSGLFGGPESETETALFNWYRISQFLVELL